MANRFFQGIMQQYKEVSDRDIGVIDLNGNVIACSILSDIGKVFDTSRFSKPGVKGIFYFESLTMQNVSCESGSYIAFVTGTDSVSEAYVNIVAVSLRNLKQFYDDKYDKSSFIKNVIFDNILPSDIYAKSRDLDFPYEQSRYVLIVDSEQRNSELLAELVSKVTSDIGNKYIIGVSKSEVAVVIDTDPDITQQLLKASAVKISKGLQKLGVTKCCIGLGTVALSLRELSRSYKEAQLSIEIGNVFDKGTDVICYDSLGIGRLIFQMPTTLCDMFISEVFKHGSIESLDDEALITIERFFENNLNVSETARKLFVHRNTLVYRLEKIKKSTGLDIREFDNAIVFKVALMVSNYLANNTKKY